MGTRGARYSDEVGQFAEEVVETFEALGLVSWRKMFGGAGIFIEDSMFALIDANARLHLKVDDTNRDRFLDVGAEKHVRMPYYSVPSEVLVDDDTLVDWARDSIEIARGG